MYILILIPPLPHFLIFVSAQNIYCYLRSCYHRSYGTCDSTGSEGHFSSCCGQFKFSCSQQDHTCKDLNICERYG